MTVEAEALYGGNKVKTGGLNLKEGVIKNPAFRLGLYVYNEEGGI